MTITKIVSGVGAFTLGFALTAGAAFAQTTTSTGAVDYSEGTYYYSYNPATGQSQAVADPHATTGATPNSSVNVSGNSSNPNQNGYLYYYSTAGAGTANGSGSAVNTGINQGTSDVTGSVTPGLPNTGAGGEAPATILALILSALAFTLGSYTIARNA